MQALIDMIFQIPALIKVLAVFGLVLVVLERKAPLWAAILAGTAALAVWFRMPVMGPGPDSAVHAAVTGATGAEALLLYGIILLILTLSRLMDAGGQLKRIVTAFSDLVGGRSITLAALPALIGLLPMPGGAIFSAPMVDTASAGYSFTPERKTAINYWFRHIWEYWWPLYPGVILAMAVSGISVEVWVGFSIPLTGFGVLAGYFFLLRGAVRLDNGDESGREGGPGRGRRLRTFAYEASPVAVVVALMLVGSLAAGALGLEQAAARSLPALAALGVGLAWTAAMNRAGPVRVLRAAVGPQTLSIVLLALAVMAFKETLTRSGAVELMAVDLERLNIPVLVVVMTLPFVSGLVTGIAVGFVGASYPLIIALLAAQGLSGQVQIMPYMLLAHGFGYMGMILSPVHLCLALTKDYYGARLPRVLWMLLPVCVTMMLVTLGFHLGYRALV